MQSSFYSGFCAATTSLHLIRNPGSEQKNYFPTKLLSFCCLVLPTSRGSAYRFSLHCAAVFASSCHHQKCFAAKQTLWYNLSLKKKRSSVCLWVRKNSNGLGQRVTLWSCKWGSSMVPLSNGPQKCPLRPQGRCKPF